MKEMIIDCLLVIALLLAGICLGFLATSYDDVYISHSTGECVKVVKPDGTLGSCSQKPKKYNVVYVK